MYFTIDLSLNYSHILNHKTALDADFSINRKTPYCFMLTWHLQNSSFTKSNYSFHLCHNLIGVVFSLHLAHMVTMLVPVCAGGDWRLGTEVPILPSSSIHHLDPPPSSSRLRSPLVRHTWGHWSHCTWWDHLWSYLVEIFLFRCIGIEFFIITVHKTHYVCQKHQPQFPLNPGTLQEIKK